MAEARRRIRSLWSVSGGVEVVYSGALAGDTTIGAGSEEMIGGGSASVTVLSGGSLALNGTDATAAFTVASGGTLVIGANNYIYAGYVLNGYAVGDGSPSMSTGLAAPSTRRSTAAATSMSTAAARSTAPRSAAVERSFCREAPPLTPRSPAVACSDQQNREECMALGARSLASLLRIE
jgi:hypothetical protein